MNLTASHTLVFIPENTQALLFDCDGTLADTMALHNHAWELTMAEFGLAIQSEALHRYAGIPTLGIAKHLVSDFNLDASPKRIAIRRDEVADSLLENITPIQIVVDVVLENARRRPMAVVSGGSAAHVRKTLKQIALSEYFRTVLTADTPLPPKPNPDLFLEAARQCEAAPERCLVFEDGDAGLEAAERAGMRAIDVRTLQGYKTRPHAVS